jgi:branched-chain amino acid transport system ATP-binding protein
MSAESVLAVRDLRIRYGNAEAVAGVSLDVTDGEVVALLGPNGAGKTSTLRAISGLQRHEGEIAFEGATTRRRSVERLTRDGLVHVPEGRRILPTLTVWENLDVARSACRNDRGMTIDEVFDLFGVLGSMANRGGWALSGGEQQMLAIGRALVSGPRLLLLDEPSLGLAPAIVRVVFRVLREVRTRFPILLVEQNTAVALDIAARAYVMSQGRIVATGTSAEIRDRGAMLDAYLGRTTVE